MQILLKLLGVVLVVSGSGCCGWYMAYGARMRIRILQELQQALLVLYGEIEYAAGDMAENMEKLGERMEYFSDFFCNISKRLNQRTGYSLYQIWKEEMKTLSCRAKLEPEDITLLEELGRNLGNLDRQTQLHTLQVLNGRLQGVLQAAKEQYGNQAKVYRVLGITVGVFTAVLLL